MSVRILLVEDHAIMAQTLAAVLDAVDGLEVVAIADTLAGAEVAGVTHRPDVVLLDQRLPDGLGTDALPRLLATWPPTKVLVVTADASDDVLVAAIQGGCAGFVQKGCRTHELVAAVESAARHEAVITAEDLRRLIPLLPPPPYEQLDDLTERESELVRRLVTRSDPLPLSDRTLMEEVDAALSRTGAHSTLEAFVVATRRGRLQGP